MSIGRILVFLAVVLGVSCVLHYYLWTRLVRDIEWPATYHRIGSASFVFLAALPLASMILMRVLPRRIASPIAWVSMSWLGLLFFLFVVLLSFDLTRAVAVRVATPVSDERRLFFARVLGGAAALVGAGLAASGAASALSKVAVKELAIPLARWNAALSGFSIVQLTDIHVGPTIGRSFIEDLVRRTNALSPDVIVITGDLVDGSVAELGHAVKPLAELKAKHGVFFVTGNHEYYSGVDEWISFLGTLGIRVLRNERVAIGGDLGFDLVGIDDFRAKDFGHGHGADLSKALAGRDPARDHPPRPPTQGDSRGGRGWHRSPTERSHARRSALPLQLLGRARSTHRRRPREGQGHLDLRFSRYRLLGPSHALGRAGRNYAHLTLEGLSAPSAKGRRAPSRQAPRPDENLVATHARDGVALVVDDAVPQLRDDGIELSRLKKSRFGAAHEKAEDATAKERYRRDASARER